MKPQRHSALYRHIGTLQGTRSWGAVLDAGTGVNSLRWIQSLPTVSWTAVTSSAIEMDRVSNMSAGTRRTRDRIILGNWADPGLLEGEIFDTVLADYLLGAVEGYAPYFQSLLFSRLRPLTRNVLYVTGLEPYVPTARPKDKAEYIIWEIGRFRDACVLLSGGLPYREYPSQWVIDQLERAGFAIGHVKRFKIAYKARFVSAQIDIAVRGLRNLPDSTLVQALRQRGEVLRQDAQKVIDEDGALRGCRNYVIAAEPV